MANPRTSATDQSSAGLDPLAVLVAAVSVARADDYAQLKALLIRKFGDKSAQLEATLASYEGKPNVWKEPLQDMLQAAGAEQDQEVLDAATRLLKRAESAQPGITGGVVGQINARGGRVLVVGRDINGSVYLGDVTIAEDTSYDVSGRPCPYLGLTSFTYQTRDRYAGREAQVDIALRLVTSPGQERSVVFVTGDSGSGKSSFVQAGLLPALELHYRARGLTLRWAVVRSGRFPLAALEDGLAQVGMSQPPLTNEGGLSHRTVGGLKQRLATSTPAGKVNVLILDQFEEHFTQADPSERTVVFDLLKDLSSFAEVRTHVLVTLRADYLAELYRVAPDLYAIQKAQSVDLHEMQPDELARAVRRPLEWQNEHYPGQEKRWQPELVERLVGDTVGQSTLLPLLQVTQEAIWQSGRLTLDRYRTLTDALEERAESVYRRRNSGQGVERPAAERQVLMFLLLDLVSVSLDDDPRRDVRRSVPKNEIIRQNPDRARLLDELVDARLLSTSMQAASGGAQGRDGDNELEIVDLIHETLLTNWERLRVSIAEQRAVLQRRERLRLAVRDWDQHARSNAYLLQGIRLAEARDLRTHDDIVLQEPGARTLLSRSNRQRRRAELIGVSVVLTILAIVSIAAVAFYSQRNEAIAHELVARSRELAATALSQLAIDPELSVLLAAQAFQVSPTQQAEDVLRDALSKSPARAILASHGGPLNSARFSSDGRLLITASDDLTASIWNVVDGSSAGVLRGHAGPILSAEFSADGALAVTASEDGTAKIWRTSSGELLADLRGHAGQVYSAHFSAQEPPLVVTSGLDGTARVWDISSGAEIAELRGHAAAVTSAEFSPDGTRVVTSSLDGTARVWDSRTAQTLVELRGHGSSVAHAEFSTDGAHIVTSSADGTARIWNALTGATESVLSGHTAGVRYAVFQPDGDLVATASLDGTARVWEASTGRSVSVLRGHASAISDLQFSPDGSRLATSSLDRTAKLWDVATGALVADFRGHTREVTSVSFSPSGRLVATAALDGTARIWSARAGDPILELRGHVGHVYAARFNPRGGALVTAGADGSARVWDTTSGRSLAEAHGNSQGVSDASFSPDGRFIATSSLDGTVQVWEAPPSPPVSERPVQLHAVSEMRGHTGWVYTADFSPPDGAYVLTAGADHTVRLWSTATGEQAAEFVGHTAAVTSARFSSDGSRIVTSSEDGTARVWDRDTHQALLELRGHTGTVRGAQFAPDGREVVTVGDDWTGRVWDATSGQPWPDVLQHTGWIYTAEFSPDGRLLVTASEDRTARVWGLSSGRVKLIAQLVGATDRVSGASFSPDGQDLATASADGVVRIYPAEMFTPAEALLNLVHLRTARELTQQERVQYMHEPP